MDHQPKSLRFSHPIKIRKIFKRCCLNVIAAIVACLLFSFFIFGLLWLAVHGDEIKFQSIIAFMQGSIIFVSILFVLWVFWFPVYQYLYFINYHYDLDDNNLFISKGVATKRELTIPLSKITDVYLDQDLVDIFLGLYDLHVSTPTEESLKFAHIAGLNKKNAMEIKEKILEKLH